MPRVSKWPFINPDRDCNCKLLQCVAPATNAILIVLCTSSVKVTCVADIFWVFFIEFIVVTADQNVVLWTCTELVYCCIACGLQVVQYGRLSCFAFL